MSTNILSTLGMFVDYAIGAEDSTLFGNLTSPYPIEVTKQMLNCFAEKYDVPIKHVDEGYSMGDTGQDLWEYSQIKALLVDPEDREYLLRELQKIKSRIMEGIRNMKDKLPTDDFVRLRMICRDVFENGQFDNRAFNSFLEQFS